MVVSSLPHHVTQRGNRREPIFFEDGDQEIYRDLLGEQVRKADVEVWAYCLMPNHVHLILNPRQADGLGRAVDEPVRTTLGTKGNGDLGVALVPKHSSGRVFGGLSNDVVLGLFRADPDMHMLPIVPDCDRGACRLLPERLAMRPRPIRCQGVDRFPSFHGVDELFRVMTGGHAATVPGSIAVHADRFRVGFLVNGVLILGAGPIFGRCCGAEDERD